MKINYFKIVKNFFVLFLLILILGACKSKKKSEISIKTFSQWKYKGKDDNWRNLYMPESIQSSLRRDTLVKNVFYRDHFLENRWIRDVAWTYRASLNVDNDYSSSHFDLNIAGLVGIADVYFNDSLVLVGKDMFIKHTIDVTPYVHKGENSLLIKFFSYEKEKKQAQKNCKFKLPFSGQEMIRLPFFYFDTTAGISYLPTGLINKVTLTRWNNVIIRNVRFNVLDIKYNKYAKIRAIYTIDAIKKTNINIEIRGKNKLYKKENISLSKGTNKYICVFQIKKPKLWWTYDMGKPNLYSIRTRIFEDKNVVQNRLTKIGIRKIEIDTSNHKFTLKLNGVPMVLKILNYTSPEIFYENLNNLKFKKIVNDFVFSNTNMVHVVETGKYEKDDFYSECDRQGVLVWQDFMLPYKILNPTQEIYNEIQIESKQNIENLRNHPCIAFWSGENFFAKYWNKNKNSSIIKDSLEINNFNHKIFMNLLPNLVSKYDSGRYYFEKMNFSSIVNITDKSPEYPNITTLRKFTSSKDRGLGTRILKLHQKPANSDSIISSNLLKTYGYVPKDISAFLYMNYLYTKNYFEKKIEKQRFSSKFNGFIAGNYRDYCPIVSTSAVDYNGFWKGKMYAIKSAFKPVLFNITEKKGWVNIDIVSDLNKDIEADFYFKLSNFEGKVFWRRNYLSNIIYKKSNRRAFSFNLSRELSKIGRNRAVFKIEVFYNQDLYAEKYFLFVPTKNQILKPPTLEKKFYKVDNGYVIEFTTNHFANGIYVFTMKNGIFSDNLFCLSPGETKKIDFRTPSEIYSINDVFSTINYTDIKYNNLFSFRRKKNIRAEK